MRSFEHSIGVVTGPDARVFTVSAKIDPATGRLGIGLTADEATKRWASSSFRGGEGRQHVLGFIVELVRAYQADRPVYRGVCVPYWARPLEAHEHTLESVATYFRDRLRENFPQEEFDVRVDPTEPALVVGG